MVAQPEISVFSNSIQQRAHDSGFAYAGRDLGGLVTWTIIAVTVARFIHALGFLICGTLEKPHILKAIGALFTYLGGLILSGLIISQAL